MDNSTLSDEIFEASLTEYISENGILDEADLYEEMQKHKGFIEDIYLPEGFKFIEINTEKGEQHD